ncbi:Queuosine Biosynthesis QueE Radical SAM [Thioalkalivibrio nitratireducens DSM 14787]|uniref:7-carboxy-7-deazaguanine synthase n=1 Tax=Thioalkalivibrio nitratireducens (strain DSM 14787 / UNIQEM 213 / ALEN2) TaxID=1255043 RepID=L0E178_THIND|nr:Queuosine Biosynthesis QueE Radical SAM [Thioalkalivibrio nitratireducens DSM 14787]
MQTLAVPDRARADSTAVRLRITETFLSLQGEAAQVGWPTVFVRLTGCPLRCRWCDTTYSFTGGQMLRLDGILDTVAGFAVRHVCVTGGEPLAQPGCLALLEALCERGFAVSLETSGALDLREVDPRVRIVMDLKAPASGESARNRLDNLALLRPGDQIKFVLADRADFDWALDLLARRPRPDGVEVLFSPVYGELEPQRLAEWILEARAPVRFQLQLHKLLWGDVAGR